jgi:O-antigen/teichoic acid export membrane protein
MKSSEAGTTTINLERRQRPMSALRWILAGNIVQRALSLVGIMLMARLVTEVEFGAYRQLLSLHLVLFVLLPLGMDQLLVREVDSRDNYLSPLWGGLFLCSLTMAAALLLGHAWVVSLLKLKDWSFLVWLVPVTIMVQGAKLWYKVLLVARLDYKTMAVGETSYVIVSNVLGVAALLLWPKAATLYIAYLAAECAEFLYLRFHIGHPLPPILKAVNGFFKPFLQHKHFCLFFCADQMLNTLGGQAPVLILGALAGKEFAAAYSMANWLVMIPLLLLIGALSRVAFPVLAAMKPEALRRQILEILHAMAALVVPVLFYIAIMAHPLVAIVLGSQYLQTAVPIIQWLVIFSVFVTLFSPISSLDILNDRADVGFYWNAATCVLRIAALIIGLHFSLIIAIATYSVVSLIMWLLWGWVLAWLMKMNLKDFSWPWVQVTPLWAVLVVLLLMVHLVPPVPFLGPRLQPFFSCAIAAIPMLVYAGLLYWKFPATFKVALRFINRKRSGFGPPAGDEATVSTERIAQ